MLKNQERSQLHKEYNFQVVKYNEYIERIIKTKFEMSYLWKYKKDYPADWKRLAEKLSCDRRDSDLLKRPFNALFSQGVLIFCIATISFPIFFILLGLEWFSVPSNKVRQKGSY